MPLYAHPPCPGIHGPAEPLSRDWVESYAQHDIETTPLTRLHLIRNIIQSQSLHTSQKVDIVGVTNGRSKISAGTTGSLRAFIVIFPLLLEVRAARSVNVRVRASPGLSDEPGKGGGATPKGHSYSINDGLAEIGFKEESV